MDCECGINKCIECTVESCKHHSGSENYCALDKIKVGTSCSDETCTDCESFEMK